MIMFCEERDPRLSVEEIESERSGIDDGEQLNNKPTPKNTTDNRSLR
jgi:hypothetical protein